MKKLFLSAIAFAGLTAATAPAFAGEAHHGHHRHHQHHGKKCAMKHGEKKADGKASQATEDLNASSLQKVQSSAPQAPAAPQVPSAPKAPATPTVPDAMTPAN